MRKRYPSDQTDAQWEIIEPLIPPAKHGGRRRKVNMREVSWRCEDARGGLFSLAATNAPAYAGSGVKSALAARDGLTIPCMRSRSRAHDRSWSARRCRPFPRNPGF